MPANQNQAYNPSGKSPPLKNQIRTISPLRGRSLLCGLTLLLATLLPAGAQNTDTPAPKREPAAPVHHSVFFPDLAANPAPLSSNQKFKLFLYNSVSPAAFVGSAFVAGVDQAWDTPEGYGQGWDGYGKRFGSSMAANASSNLFGTYILASAFHQDPRYFVMGDGSLKQSIKYAMRRVFITRRDSGGDVFNWSGLLGPLAAQGIANSYLPEHERTVGRTFERYGVSLATTAGLNLLKEFWPTIFKKSKPAYTTPHQ